MSVDRELQVLVVGGGLAGLATARALAAAGLDPLVVEREESLEDPAGPVELRPDAMAVLSWLGVAGAVREAGTPVRTWVHRADDGSVARRRSAESPVLVGVEYGRLRGVLAAALPDSAVRTDVGVAAVRPGDRSVTVEFGNGVTERFDLVVGADGARSTVRAALADRDPRPRASASVALPAASRDADALQEQWRPGGTVLRAVPGGDRPWCWVTLPAAALSPGSDPGSVAADCLADADWVDAAPGGSAPVAVHEDRPGRGDLPVGDRVALVGDAAHARHRLAGVGPALALEDAAVLADALAGEEDSLAARLGAYAASRRERLRTLDPDPDPGGALAAVRSRVPDHLETPLALRSARLAAGLSDAPARPAVERPAVTR